MTAPLSDWLTSIIRNGRWYLLSSVASKGLALISLKIVTYHLSPADFGSLNTLVALTLALPIFLSLYLDAALGRIYHDYSSSPSALTALFSTVFWFVTIWGAGIVTLFALIAKPLAMVDASTDLTLIWVAAGPMLFLQLSQLGLVYLRQSFESQRVTMVETGGALAGVIATYLLVATLNEGVLGRLIAIAISSLFSFLIVAVWFWRKGLLRFTFRPSMLKECLIFSIPLLPNLAAGWIVSTSDRLIISKYANPEAVGLYSLAVTVASLLYVVQDAVTQVTSVTSQAGMTRNREETLAMISRLSLVMWVVMLYVDYGVVAYSELVIRIFSSEKYLAAASLIGVCGFTYVVSPQSRILQDLVGYSKQTWLISSGAIIMAVASLALNFVLVPRFGYTAAPYAFIAATVIQTAWLYVWVARSEKLRLPFGKALIAFAIFLVFIAIDRFIPYQGLTGMAVRVVPTLIYGAITLALALSSLKALKGRIA